MEANLLRQQSIIIESPGHKYNDADYKNMSIYGVTNVKDDNEESYTCLEDKQKLIGPCRWNVVGLQSYEFSE